MKIASPVKISEAIEAFIASIIKNTPKMENSGKPSTFKTANRYSDSWLAVDKPKRDKEKQ